MLSQFELTKQHLKALSRREKRKLVLSCYVQDLCCEKQKRLLGILQRDSNEAKKNGTLELKNQAS